MRVLVTGNEGYIGQALIPQLLAAGHEVEGIDAGWLAGCTVGAEPRPIRTRTLDIRDVRANDLARVDAVVHLAAAPDAAGTAEPAAVYAINYTAAVDLARAAKRAGVQRFLFASISTFYAASGEGLLTERARFHPATPAARAKLLAEREIAQLADTYFSPTFLRCGEAYGWGPRLRGDLLVNRWTAEALSNGTITLGPRAAQSRPFAHVTDVARAFVAVLQASRARVHNQALHVGRIDANYALGEVAALVQQAVPGSRLVRIDGDPACAGGSQRVSCDKIAGALPEYQPQWTVRDGICELLAAYRRHGVTAADLAGPSAQRASRLAQLQASGRLDDALRWRVPATAGSNGRGP